MIRENDFNKFIESCESNIISAPNGLKKEILHSAAHIKNDNNEYKKKEKSNRKQLFFYSLKVGCACACAVLIIALSMIFGDPDISKNNIMDSNDKFNITDSILDSTEKISNGFLKFTNEIINVEEKEDNDTQEK